MWLKRWRVHVHGQWVIIRKAEGGQRKPVVSSEKLEDGGFLVEFGNGVRQGFLKRVGVGLLTKFCKRSHPRTAVFSIIARCYGSVVVSGVVLRSRNLKTSHQQKELTMSTPSPIIGREALLSRIDWETQMRRQQHERAISGDLGTGEATPGGARTSHYRAVSANDSPTARSERRRAQGARGEEGA